MGDHGSMEGMPVVEELLPIILLTRASTLSIVGARWTTAGDIDARECEEHASLQPFN